MSSFIIWLLLVIGLVVEIAFAVKLDATPAPYAVVREELTTCRDDTWSRAYMIRRPGDPHGIEWCEHIARGGAARFSTPIQAKEAAR